MSTDQGAVCDQLRQLHAYLRGLIRPTINPQFSVFQTNARALIARLVTILSKGSVGDEAIRVLDVGGGQLSWTRYGSHSPSCGKSAGRISTTACNMYLQPPEVQSTWWNS